MKLEGFQVTNFRNIHDSGWIGTTQITAFVGQNEAGKSNLFDALYVLHPIIAEDRYSIDEDWPVDQWSQKKSAKGTRVCRASFTLSAEEIADLAKAAQVKSEAKAGEEEKPAADKPATPLPATAKIELSRAYDSVTEFQVIGFDEGILDSAKVAAWAKRAVPRFVRIHDYEMSGAQVELDQLKQRWDAVGKENRHQLKNEDQTILIVLELANIDLDDFIAKGKTPEGRTVRSFDKRSASKYLSSQFASLWQQKEVAFDIDIDGTTLNIFVEDRTLGMPVRLHRRSTGFRWYVSFAWKFTHASKGEFKNCVLLLEEPGIHLHFSGQRDLLKVFDRLAENNSVLYTTHLASMVDAANPERVRIIETRDNHLAVTEGIVSSQKEPMAVIEQSLGLTGDQSGLLGNRQVLIVEGGDDAVVLHKLSGLLAADKKQGLSERIYVWPARGASKTPMYAGFSIGQGWDAGVLLDTDKAGHDAKKKIDELYISKLAEAKKQRFRMFMFGKAIGSPKTDCGIEDIFPDQFYVDHVNSTYGIALKLEELPKDGSDMIVKRVEAVLQSKYGHKELDKRRVFGDILKTFDKWKTVADLPEGTATRAESLFKVMNAAFADKPAQNSPEKK